MEDINKINIKVLDKNTELGNSRLEFKISSKNINYVVMNTLRRTCMSDIPIYAFNEFKFDKNNAIFHNNYLKLRLRQMPVWAIDNTIDYIENNTSNKNDINDEEEDNILQNDGDEVQLDVDKNLNTSSLKQLTMYINHKNKENNIITVTSEHAKFYYEEKQISSPYKTAIPIVKLQPNQEIAFSAITKIGTEQEDAMFSAVCICVYKQINDNEFDFIIESRGQITEKRILQVAIINIERKLKNFLKLIQEKSDIDKDKSSGVIIVNNEDHTLGNIISKGMQDHKMITFAGYKLTHPLVKKVNIEYKLNKDGNIKQVIKDVVEYYLELFSEINKSINSI